MNKDHYCSYCNQWADGAVRCCPEYDGTTYIREREENMNSIDDYTTEMEQKFFKYSAALYFLIGYFGTDTSVDEDEDAIKDLLEDEFPELKLRRPII